MKHLLLLLLLSAAAAARSAGGRVSVPLGRRPKPARAAFAPPWHRRWSPKLGVGKAATAEGSKSAEAQAAAAAGTAVADQPMYGDLTTLGEYYLELPVGGQVINVQLDTGSSTLAVPLESCANCRPAAHRFNLAKAGPNASLVRCSAPACAPDTCHAYGRRGACSACDAKSNACCSSVDPDKCGFFLQYADGSGAAGALVEADVTLAGMTTPLVFGSILRVSKDFESSAVDGILGMAFGSLACNPTCVTPLFDALVKSGQVEHDVFALCTGPHGGTLSLGGSDPDMYEGDLKYVPLSSRRKERHFYDVDIIGTKVGGRSVTLPDFSDGIVDSGTTVLVVAPRAYNALRKYFQSHFCDVPGLCSTAAHGGGGGGRGHAARDVDIIHVSPEQAALVWQQRMRNLTHEAGEDDFYASGEEESMTWFAPGYCAMLTEDDVAKLPDISIILAGGVQLDVSAEDYMLRYEQPSRYPWNRIVFRCLGITPLPGLDDMENNAIIGDSWLQKFYVEYDRESMRLGFAPSKHCIPPGQELTPWLQDGQNEDEGLMPRSSALSPMFLILLVLGSILSWSIVVALCCCRKNGDEPVREHYQVIR